MKSQIKKEKNTQIKYLLFVKNEFMYMVRRY